MFKTIKNVKHMNTNTAFTKKWYGAITIARVSPGLMG